MAKSQNKCNRSRTKTFFEGSRVSKIGPRTGPKLVPNRVFDAEALRKPLESFLERSWKPQEPEKNKLGTALGRLGPKKGAEIGGPKSDPKTLQDAFRSPRGAKRLPGSNT